MRFQICIACLRKFVTKRTSWSYWTILIRNSWMKLQHAYIWTQCFRLPVLCPKCFPLACTVLFHHPVTNKIETVRFFRVCWFVARQYISRIYFRHTFTGFRAKACPFKISQQRYVFYHVVSLPKIYGYCYPSMKFQYVWIGDFSIAKGCAYFLLKANGHTYHKFKESSWLFEISVGG